MIRLVVDSNSQVTNELRDRFAMSVVALTVTVDGVGLREGVEIDAAGITAALSRTAEVGTSTPSPGEFLQTYEQAANEGATEILSVHAGGRASATANTARLAATMATVPVEVVDTGTASFPVALCAWAAGDVIAAGGSVAEAAAAARRVAGLVDNVFIVGALALARRGGRLGPDTGPDTGTGTGTGPDPDTGTGTDPGTDPDTDPGTDTDKSPTGIPVLALADGVMTTVGRVTDTDLAVEAMVAYVVEHAEGRRLRVAVGELGATQLADDLERALRARLEVEQLVRYVVGPSVAVHSGLGTVGCVFHPVDRPAGYVAQSTAQPDRSPSRAGER